MTVVGFEGPISRNQICDFVSQPGTRYDASFYSASASPFRTQLEADAEK